MWVVQSILLYVAPIQYKALKFREYKTLIKSTQRKALLRVTSFYKNVPPIYLLAKEKPRLYRREDENMAKGEREMNNSREKKEEMDRGSREREKPMTKIENI